MFPMLRILKLQQARIWCGLCHTCSIPKFQRPKPEMIRYKNGIGLPRHYSQAFASLLNLETVYLTVGVLESGKTILGSEEGKNLNYWSGECDRCMEVMYDDETFRRDWVAKKKNWVTKPPRLSTVEWHFCLVQDDEEDWVDLGSASDDE
ncbi:hypothetical protein BDP27DRAFT_255626 [Rhodocollybia butyracea]|uniref:Uncharacterized protein n=1 Tax=Rhodocollybia butyracea TaxID=206335 RepID=A0A9P5U1K7_9AGAR|nr:hypothetical protein BDP27DRAFT_255626 [Rhodocollybia butyracea]